MIRVKVNGRVSGALFISLVKVLWSTSPSNVCSRAIARADRGPRSITANSPKKSFFSKIAKVSCKPWRPVFEIWTRPRPTSISVDPAVPSSKIKSPGRYSTSWMSTERSTSGVNPSKSRLERNASFMADKLNVDSSILQHRTFFLRAAPHVASSGRRRQTSRLAHRSRPPASKQSVPELQDAEYSLGVTNLYDFGGSRLLRLSRLAISSRTGLLSQNRLGKGSVQFVVQLQPGIRLPAEFWQSPSGQSDKIRSSSGGFF